MKDSFTNVGRQFDLAWAVGRELLVRNGKADPINDDERRLAAAGPVSDWRDTEAFQNPPWERRAAE